MLKWTETNCLLKMYCTLFSSFVLSLGVLHSAWMSTMKLSRACVTHLRRITRRSCRKRKVTKTKIKMQKKPLKNSSRRWKKIMTNKLIMKFFAAESSLFLSLRLASGRCESVDRYLSKPNYDEFQQEQTRIVVRWHIKELIK